MAPKTEVKDHLVFLWDCLENAQANGGKVNFSEVGDLHSTNHNAARMRHSRMSKTIATYKSEAQNGNNDGALQARPENGGPQKSNRKVKGKGKDASEAPNTKQNRKRKSTTDENHDDGAHVDDVNEEEAPKKQKKRTKLSESKTNHEGVNSSGEGQSQSQINPEEEGI